MKKTKISLRQSAVSPANAIFIIDCLGETDAQSGKRRHEEILDELLADNPSSDSEFNRIKHKKASKLDPLEKIFREIFESGKKVWGPLIVSQKEKRISQKRLTNVLFHRRRNSCLL